MVKTNSIPSMSPPDDTAAHIEALRKALDAGDIIALIQAEQFVQETGINAPDWVLKPLEDTMVGVLTQRRGSKGKGNSAFGSLRKCLVRTVRASAYHYVRAWQNDPHRYYDLPIQTFEQWRKEPTLWQSYRKASDAARLASTSLHSTEYLANASTVRRAAYLFPFPMMWGREEAEAKLGLRGPKGIFGPKTDQLEPQIASLLAKRSPKA
ncbi:hypothetical protein [Ruegeria arenilitoris]|uniref:hypothetical protein n=1 Tax=Ruegeria arenilitoris TaxID=1173585 RepID=UPI0014799169|nr:hypothetical protein [Ruegeria arenilitoris]